MTISNSSSASQMPATPLPMPVPKPSTDDPALAASRANSEAFTKLDKDKSGDLSVDEVVNGAKGYKGRVSELKFKDYDTNGDKKISKKEFDKGRLEDRLTEREISVENQSNAEFKVRDADGSHGLSAKELGKHGAKKLEKFDKDGDGELSKKEYLAQSVAEHKREIENRALAAEPPKGKDKKED